MLNYYYDKTFTRILNLKTKGDSPRTAYRKQLTVLYENILEHKDFISMQMKEGSLPYTEEVEQCAKKFASPHFNFISTAC